MPVVASPIDTPIGLNRLTTAPARACVRRGKTSDTIRMPTVKRIWRALPVSQWLLALTCGFLPALETHCTNTATRDRRWPSEAVRSFTMPT